MARTEYYNSKQIKIPSVTTVLGIINKPALVPWANKLGLQGINSSNYVSETAIIGTATHELIELYIKNKPMNFEDFKCNKEQFKQAQIGFEKFKEWLLYQDSFELIASEKKLVSNKYNYGGTIDCITKLNGIVTLIDFKTSASIYSEHKFQVSAYKELATENNYNIGQVVILRVGRDNQENYFEYVPLSKKQLQQGFKVFRAALKLYVENKKFEREKK